MDWMLTDLQKAELALQSGPVGYKPDYVHFTREGDDYVVTVIHYIDAHTTREATIQPDGDTVVQYFNTPF